MFIKTNEKKYSGITELDIASARKEYWVSKDKPLIDRVHIPAFLNNDEVFAKNALAVNISNIGFFSEEIRNNPKIMGDAFANPDIYSNSHSSNNNSLDETFKASGLVSSNLLEKLSFVSDLLDRNPRTASLFFNPFYNKMEESIRAKSINRSDFDAIRQTKEYEDFQEATLSKLKSMADKPETIHPFDLPILASDLKLASMMVGRDWRNHLALSTHAWKEPDVLYGLFKRKRLFDVAKNPTEPAFNYGEIIDHMPASAIAGKDSATLKVADMLLQRFPFEIDSKLMQAYKDNNFPRNVDADIANGVHLKQFYDCGDDMFDSFLKNIDKNKTSELVKKEHQSLIDFIAKGCSSESLQDGHSFFKSPVCKKACLDELTYRGEIIKERSLLSKLGENVAISLDNGISAAMEKMSPFFDKQRDRKLDAMRKERDKNKDSSSSNSSLKR